MAATKKISIVLLFVLVNACGNNFPVIHDFKNEDFTLLNADSAEMNFPSVFKGKIIVAGFIFTNCPDICPLTTNNMRIIQEKLKELKMGNVEFAAISFDPKHDTPKVLRDYIRIRKFDTDNWTFFTGNQQVIDSLLKVSEVFAIPSDTSFVAGEEKVTFIHTDRIMLIDGDLRIRKNYPGSTINIDEIIDDIQKL